MRHCKKSILSSKSSNRPNRSMMRLPFLILLLGCLSILTARENPFVPVPETPEAVAPVHESGIVILSDEEVAQLKSEEQDMPLVQESTVSEAQTETINFQQVRFLFSDGQIRIETKDRLKKDFALTDPARIILDFATAADFPSRKRSLSTPPFSALRLGAHNGYYRVVIELEKRAGYKIEPYRYGYILSLD